MLVLPQKNRWTTGGVLLLAAWLACAGARAEEGSDPEAAAEPAREMEEILVHGSVEPHERIRIDPARLPPFETDTAELLNRVPGGAVNWNGPLTGEVQLRGLAGDRVRVTVGGAEIAPGGPNRMDAPLHYAPRTLLESLDLQRGIASVSEGPETVGGAVDARLKRSYFGETSEWTFGSEVNATGRSVDDSSATGGIVYGATDRVRAHLLGSYERGDDYDSNEGRVRPTEFKRAVYGAGGGLRLDEHDFGLEYRNYDTRDTGTPALPLDIDTNETDLWQATYDGRLGDVELEAHFSHSDVEHEMDNFRERQAPANPDAFRSSKAEAKGLGYRLEVRRDLWGGVVELGVDGYRASHDQRIRNPNNPGFFVQNFDDAEKNRYGAFVQWRGRLQERVEIELGVRYTRVHTDADQVDITPGAPLPAQNLRIRFNRSDRSRSDDLVDAVARLSIPLWDGIRVEATGARKTRAPNYIERFSWLPIEVTGGLADGNVYVGKIGLRPETYYEVDAGLVFSGSWFHFAPRGFYKYVDDYVQGIPSNDPDVVLITGGTGLQFSNVEAELFGIDAEWALRGPWGLRFDGLFSWVRGKRRDTSDELYRIAPLRMRGTLSLERPSWRVGVEAVWVARQKKVAESLDESVTDGYELVNFFASLTPTRWLQLDLGLENAFDIDARDHLAGTNRVAGSAVAVGDKLPRHGRNVVGRITLRW